MEELEKAARNYHATYRAATYAQEHEATALEAMKADNTLQNTLAWVDALHIRKDAIIKQADALTTLLSAALQVPEVF